MKKIAKIAMTLVMVFTVLFSLAAPASAATVKSVSYSTTDKGGNKATVFYVNANNKKTTNIKDVTSKTLSMKGYTQYKVQVYAWKASTIGSYMGGVCNSVNAGWCDWAGKSLPKCTFKAYSNVSSLAK